MGIRLFSLATLIVGGSMAANAIANPDKTKTLIDSFSALWTSSLKSLRS